MTVETLLLSEDWKAPGTESLMSFVSSVMKVRTVCSTISHERGRSGGKRLQDGDPGKEKVASRLRLGVWSRRACEPQFVPGVLVLSWKTSRSVHCACVLIRGLVI